MKWMAVCALAVVLATWCSACTPISPSTNENANTGGVDNTNGNVGNGAEVIFPVDYAATFVEVRDCRTTIEHAASNILAIRVVASPDAVDAYHAFGVIPEGGVIVKEEFSDAACQNLTQYRPMKKEAPGFDANTGDWHFQKVTAARQILEDGPDTCIACHSRPECLVRDYMCECPCPDDPG